MSLFRESPWKSIPLPEPVHVEPGKHYVMDIDAETGQPSVREAAAGLTFPQAGTITALMVFGASGDGAVYMRDVNE